MSLGPDKNRAMPIMPRIPSMFASQQQNPLKSLAAVAVTFRWLQYDLWAVGEIHLWQVSVSATWRNAAYAHAAP